MYKKCIPEGIIMVTAEEAERLYTKKKYISEDIYVEWELIHSSPKATRYVISVPVLTDDGEELCLKGNYSCSSRRQNYSFALLYKSSVPIRRWDYAPHKYEARTSHKHKWDGVGDHEAYIVTDITLNDVNQAFFDFLNECNIEFRGCYTQILVIPSS